MERNQLVFIDSEYDWKKITLWEFLDEGNIPRTWEEFFHDGKVQEELQYISCELDKEEYTIYPSINQVFRAFYMCPLTSVKSVILGMDPYHNGSAVGLCFSVKPGNKINPSMRVIYKELKREGFTPTEDGVLTRWAKEGVLLLNTALTVRKGEADSHTFIWEHFSEMLIKFIDKKRKEKVHWLLFGKNAHSVGNHLNNGNVYKTTHPSPLSAYKNSSTAISFYGSNIFKQVPNVIW